MKYLQELQAAALVQAFPRIKEKLAQSSRLLAVTALVTMASVAAQEANAQIVPDGTSQYSEQQGSGTARTERRSTSTISKETCKGMGAAVGSGAGAAIGVGINNNGWVAGIGAALGNLAGQIAGDMMCDKTEAEIQQERMARTQGANGYGYGNQARVQYAEQGGIKPSLSSQEFQDVKDSVAYAMTMKDGWLQALKKGHGQEEAERRFLDAREGIKSTVLKMSSQNRDLTFFAEPVNGLMSLPAGKGETYETVRRMDQSLRDRSIEYRRANDEAHRSVGAVLGSAANNATDLIKSSARMFGR